MVLPIKAFSLSVCAKREAADLSHMTRSFTVSDLITAYSDSCYFFVLVLVLSLILCFLC